MHSTVRNITRTCMVMPSVHPWLQVFSCKRTKPMWKKVVAVVVEYLLLWFWSLTQGTEEFLFLLQVAVTRHLYSLLDHKMIKIVVSGTLLCRSIHCYLLHTFPSDLSSAGSPTGYVCPEPTLLDAAPTQSYEWITAQRACKPRRERQHMAGGCIEGDFQIKAEQSAQHSSYRTGANFYRYLRGEKNPQNLKKTKKWLCWCWDSALPTFEE